MTTEIQAVLGAVIILILLIAAQGVLVPLNQGFAWGLGPRDDPREPSRLQGRLRRATANHMEAMMLFVPTILVAQTIGVATDLTAIGAMLFLAARAIYPVAYLAGVPPIRTLVWTVGTAGVLMVVFETAKAAI